MGGLDQAETFISTYKQYKKDTEYIAGWLAETSQQNAQSRPQPKKKGSKGKGAKTKTKRYIIKVSDFVPMAEAIAKGSSDLLVPVALSRVFNRAIQTRRKVSNWFENKLDVDLESNKRHHYFVTILEDAFRILRPCISVSPGIAKSGSPDPESATLSLENRFAGLTIEEVSEIAAETGAEEESLPKVADVVLQRDESEMEEEFIFAVKLFLYELETIREVVRGHWEKYQSGEVDLVVAAMVTDMAIKLAQKAETLFGFEVERPERYPVSAYPISRLIEELTTPSGDVVAASQSREDKTVGFLPVYTGLRHYLDKVIKAKDKKIPVVVPKDFGNATVHKHTLGAIEFAQIIRLIMFQRDMEKNRGKEDGNHPRVWDLVSKGVIEMFENRAISVCTIFALQLHLDSQDVLADKTKFPAFELTTHLQHLIRQNNKMAEEHSPFLPDDVGRWVHEKLLDTLNDGHKWVSEEGGFDAQWKSLLLSPKVASHPVLKTLRKEKNYFLEHHPLLCGMMKYALYVEYYHAGIFHEEQSSGIMEMAHIYVAGRLLSPGKPVWPDMELMIYAQDPGHLFVGGLPTTLREARNKHLTAMGSVATNSARDLQLRNMKVDYKRMRQFRYTSVFGDRLLLAGDGSIGDVDVAIQRLFQAMRSPQPWWGRLARRLVPPEHQHLDDGKAMLPKDILRSFAAWLQADTVELLIDWLHMQMLCGTIWTHCFFELEKLPGWDLDASCGGKPAVEPAQDIIVSKYGDTSFLSTAFAEVMKVILRQELEVTKKIRCGDVCLRLLARYHKRTARMIFEPAGPVNIHTLHKDWKDEWWKEKWEQLMASTEDKPQEQDIKSIFMEQFFAQMGTGTDAKNLREISEEVLKPYLDAVFEACQESNYIPEAFR